LYLLVIMVEIDEEVTHLGFRCPPELARKVRESMRDRHFATTSEYVRSLVRDDVERWEATRQQPSDEASPLATTGKEAR